MNADAAADRLAKIAEEVAPEVLEEAMAEARRRAVAELADWLAPAIIAAALGSASVRERKTRTDSAPAEPRREPPPRGAVYAYGVVPRDLSLDDVTGVGDAPVRTIPHGDLALLVSDIEADLLQGLETDVLTAESQVAMLAQRHHDVVNAAFEAGAVVPLRFATVLHDDAAADRMLKQDYARWRDDLARISGKVEYTVRVLAGQQVEPQQAQAGPSVQDSATPGTSYLRARADELSRHEDQRRADDAAARRALESLAAIASEVSDRVAATQTEDTIAEATYLVPSSRQDEFFSETKHIGRDLESEGMAVRVSGPWPPYTFVQPTSEAA